jgi:ubiquitin C-terminal hydrolase
MTGFLQKKGSREHHHSVRPISKFHQRNTVANDVKKGGLHSNQNVKKTDSTPFERKSSSKCSKPPTEILESAVVLEFVQWKSASKPGPGLLNHGNTCFLNSTIQCLLHTPPLAQVLLKKSSLAMRGLSSKNNQQSSIMQLYQRFQLNCFKNMGINNYEQYCVNFPPLFTVL